MNFWDKITGNDMNREMAAFNERAAVLPADYQSAWQEIKVCVLPYSDFTGRNLMPVLDGIMSLLEESAAEGESIQEVLGDDIKGFCAALLGEEGAGTYRDKWRAQLNRSVAAKLEKSGGRK